MIQFILNDKSIKTTKPGGMTLLDFVRYEKQLTGTKIGCREGDCGACTILIGEMYNGRLRYRSMTSCITPLRNVDGKHVVTVEGLNVQGLNPIQQAFVDEGASQCGFCTVGFIVSLGGYCLETINASYDQAISAIDGNICRCTGYKSIERATQRVVDHLKNKDLKNPLNWLVGEKYIPAYFTEIPERLEGLAVNIQSNGHGTNGNLNMVGGGTDLYVQRPDDFAEADVKPMFLDNQLKMISIQGNRMNLGPSVTVTDLMESQEFNQYFPDLWQHLKLVSSTPIRNMGTISGNFVNASPIGDMTIFFLALDSLLILRDVKGETREVALKDFYFGYKQLDLIKGEAIDQIVFDLPDKQTQFNFEKVSKRTYLDIASVNSAISIKLENEVIKEVHASAGGVGPTPIYLKNTCQFLRDKKLDIDLIKQATEVIPEDISPISDVRGSKEYKSLLLKQLFYAHFIELFPQKFEMEVLL